jgi:hypothetical protein
LRCGNPAALGQKRIETKVISIRSAYTDLFLGAKSYFRESDRSEWGVSFSAACLLAGLTMVNVVGFVFLADHVFYGRMEWANIILSGRARVAALACGVLVLHILSAKALGIYGAVGYERPAAWPANALGIAAIGLAAFVVGIGIGLAGN